MPSQASGRDLFIVDNSVSGWTGLRYLEGSGANVLSEHQAAQARISGSALWVSAEAEG